MLTASLQSTWEQKNSRQSRPKYGSYQTNYGEDAEGKASSYPAQDKTLGKSNNYSVQQSQLQASYYNQTGSRVAGNEGGNSTELPNLKVPQVPFCF